MSLLSYLLKLYPAGSTASGSANPSSQAQGSDPSVDEGAQPSLTVVDPGDAAPVESVTGEGSPFGIVRPIRTATSDGNSDPFGDFCA